VLIYTVDTAFILSSGISLGPGLPLSRAPILRVGDVIKLKFPDAVEVATSIHGLATLLTKPECVLQVVLPPGFTPVPPPGTEIHLGAEP
jgi:hypothetical protein